MIKVGFNENVILKNVELSEKEGKYAVDFVFRAADSASESLEDEYDENGMIVTGGKFDSTIKVWPLTLQDDPPGKVRSVKERIEATKKASQEMQNLFMAFANCLSPTVVKFNRYEGIPLTLDTMSNILNNEVLLQITKNLANQFIAACSPYFDSDDHKLRLLCVRQSKKNHYPGFRKAFLSAFPFVEPAIIPKEHSKLMFTDYEVKNGFNSGTPVATDEVKEETVDLSSLLTPSADITSDTNLN